jgi:hypothetical protein
MLHLTTTIIRTILALYRKNKIRNVREIHAVLSLWHPYLVTNPHTVDADSFEEEHTQDIMPIAQYRALVAVAGVPRKNRDRVPSDKEKIIEVLNEAKCTEWVDVTLSKADLRKLRKMGIRALGEFEGRDSVVEEDVEMEEEGEGNEEVLSLELPVADVSQ